MTKKFSELANGEKFVINQKEYEKVAPVKVSCCKTINAVLTTNAKTRIFLQPNAEVEIKE